MDDVDMSLIVDRNACAKDSSNPVYHIYAMKVKLLSLSGCDDAC
jgi:hypothetical protein